MKKRRKRQRNIRKSIIAFLFAAAVLFQAAKEELVVCATTIEGIKGQIEEDQNHLNRINDRISSLEDEQDLIEEQIADLNSEILNMMTSIQLKESEISSKEDAIAAGKAALGDKLAGNIVKEIYVPKKIVNLVVK